MTFNEWFEKYESKFPIAEVFDGEDFRKEMRDAWEAGWQSGNEDGYTDGLEDGRIYAEVENK